MAFPIGWQRCCAISIQASNVVADSLSNMPVLITNASGQLPAEMVTSGGANAAQANGGDIRFTSDAPGQNLLGCEIVVWTQNATPASAVAVIWVTPPALSGYTNTIIYVWYKPTTTQTQPAASAAGGSQSVWANQYGCVWHGGTAGSLSLADSTSNGNTLTNNGTVTVTAGPISGGGAGSFNGSSQYLSNTSPTGVPNSGPITIEAWVYLTDNTALRCAMAATKYGGSAASVAYVAIEYSPHALQPVVYLNSALTYNPAITLNAWTHIAVTFFSTTWQMYVNGGWIASATTTAFTFGAAQVFIGALDGPSYYWEGKVAEVRISTAIRPSTWLATQHNNQTSPGTFAAAGTPFGPGAYATPGGYYGNGRLLP